MESVGVVCMESVGVVCGECRGGDSEGGGPWRR